MTQVEIGTINIEETVDWEDLAPACEAANCLTNGKSDLVAEHRHFGPVNCSNERKTYLLCTPCYEFLKTQPYVCVRCEEPSGIFIR
jgi:hypothetical protein